MKSFYEWLNEAFLKPIPPSPPKPYVMPSEKQKNLSDPNENEDYEKERKRVYDAIITKISEDFNGILQNTGFSKNIQFKNNKFGGKSFVRVIDDPNSLLFTITHYDANNKNMATLEKVNAPRLREHLARYLK
jgi:hypothetical protein